MKSLPFIACLALAIISQGCARPSKSDMATALALSEANDAAEREYYAAGSSKSMVAGVPVDTSLPQIPADESPSPTTSGSQPIARKMTYSARYTLGVYQIWPVMEKLEYLAAKHDGYVQRQTTDTIVLRIPAAGFAEARNSIESLGRVMEKSIEANDVTEQYTDLSLRLKMRQAYLAELQALLQKTTDVKQMLAIRQEIAKTVEEIELLQGRLNYLTNQVAYSTIAVKLVKTFEQKGTRISLPFYWIQTLDLEYLLERY